MMADIRYCYYIVSIIIAYCLLLLYRLFIIVYNNSNVL